jgi:hypothetical protein
MSGLAAASDASRRLVLSLVELGTSHTDVGLVLDFLAIRPALTTHSHTQRSGWLAFFCTWE